MCTVVGHMAVCLQDVCPQAVGLQAAQEAWCCQQGAWWVDLAEVCRQAQNDQHNALPGPTAAERDSKRAGGQVCSQCYCQVLGGTE
jgi:hypothetical protein